MTPKVSAKKSLGQNFLVNPGIVAKIIIAADLSPDDAVLEVGPGTGILTRALAASGARIVAVEKDRRLIQDLQAEFSAAQIEIIEADILAFDPAAHGLAEGEYKIVANLPYYITSHFIRTMFEHWLQPKLAILMVQREVAQRMMAAPPDMNLLALSVQYYADIELIAQVSKGSFRPEPAVDSAVVALRPKLNLPLTAEQEALLFTLAKTAFGGKRKMLLNTLSTKYPRTDIMEAFHTLHLDPTMRPENVSLSQWQSLAAAWSLHSAEETP